MKFRYIILFILGLIVVSETQAQDGHYSQYQNVPLLLNPALTGDLDYKRRLGASYRSQWANIRAPYTNYGVFYDKTGKRLNWGLLLNQNAAGSASLKTTNVLFSTSIRKYLGLDRRTYLAAGAQFGIGQRGFDPTAFAFDNQYNADSGFDPVNSNGETFNQTNVVVPDLNAGLLFNTKVGDKNEVQVGASMYHINNGSASFYNDDSVQYPRRTVVFGRLNMVISDELSIQPQFMYMTQETAREILIGALGQYKLTKDIGLNFGANFRLGDAFILQGGIDYNNITVGLSYDANVSTLTTASNGVGGFELTALYRFGEQEKRMAIARVDTDGDGIYDDKDKCPNVPGIKKLRGCPEANPVDTDGDGIVDAEDACPTVPGVVAMNGCPQGQKQYDSDGDGILDVDDACPMIVGVASNKGCPLNPNMDSDGDGILDKDDACPQVPGVPALSGCPFKDQDGDGVRDADDECPTVPGDPAMRGCPLSDLDNDGIPDKDDLCPYVPGIAKYQGCNDTDQDGIWDHLDVCPKIYGEIANNGCPVNNLNLDSDNDGILDKDDKCMYLRGSVEHNGCPDSDKDGVSDIEDDCPFIKGTITNNGCPTEDPLPTSETAMPTEISIDVVEFDFDKDYLKPYYHPMLNRVVKILNDNPTYSIMLSGHTDSEGNDMYNYQLGQRRAAVVFNYLVNQGVSPSKIKYLSYGESIPKRQNKTEEDKARNRRTEIIIIK